MFSKLLVATDGSNQALKAAATAGDIARKYGSAVTILHVFTNPAARMPSAETPGIELDRATVDGMARDVHDCVARKTGQALEACGVPYESLLGMGHPADEILRVASQGGYDLIVLGSRGAGSLRSFLLGSVADKVRHHAQCPVLLVR
ncbi:MAG: universal stress protein [Armatimonadetes bacterium]|nr:universal stress protein [Armatimonadota bacterium]